ncbi:PREDICTED: SEC23-interacting protein-like isoform X2 [Vollenhovia emeryi]|uniref:SEC23-interacting protein-like isoform X2 n=1 Tax=Vollenhovia emeryi TaxID=411798 RepID=UPI0005F3CC48|nr:PREDICTED: SEC23-interacting protein-like isoform X2 [Vollenhovia emeryi]
MNGSSRKVKNPLLSGAGPGFPFDNYAENTLLVPVTPATPAVLRDDPELDKFIGQEPVNIQSSSRTNKDSPTNASFQPKESKNTENRPAKTAYDRITPLSSISSSLSNLLSSTKSDSLGPQISQTPENTSGTTHESNPNTVSRPVKFLDSPSTNLSGFTYTASPIDTVPNPLQPAAPPSISQPGYAPVSYRLGNQRRLKYAPPPDLTSNNASTYPDPTFPSYLLQSQHGSAPTILNPCESEGLAQGNSSNTQQISALPEQLPTSEQLSRNSSLHNSFRSSPVTAGTTSYNSPIPSANQHTFFENTFASGQFLPSLSRQIPARVLEPATPQNTPANVSFPSFASYRDLPSTSNFDKEIAALKNPNLNSPPEFSKGNTLETTESAYKPTLISGETGATFTPISAAKVTEKLEHLLAEQEYSCAATPSEVDEITTSRVATELAAKSIEPQSEALKATNEIIDKSHEAKLNDVQGKAAQAGSDTWSDVFLGQEPAAQSVICPEIHTTDNSVTDLQAAKSNVHPPQQHYQVQSIPAPSSTFYTNKSAEQKSSLNYVSPVQLPQKVSSSASDFYNLSKPTEQSTNVFFESAKPSRVSSFPSPESNTNSPFGQPVINITNNPLQAQENSAFSSKATNSTDLHVPFWNADQSQVLNVAPNQPVYTAHNQPVYAAPIQQSAPVFYNPVQFANEPSKQPTFPHTYDQRPPQQQSYQNPPFYGSELQQPFASPENSIAYPTPAVSLATSVPEPTGSATLSPVQMSVNSPINRATPDTVPPSFQNWASGSSDKYTTNFRMQYRPVYHHWFYRKDVENKTLWLPFSMQDSLKLEDAHNSSDITPETTVATDGGRYDVDILRRQRAPVYWTGTSTEVRRCSWFFKGATEARYVPYNENIAAKLEDEYKLACQSNNWNRKVELSNGEYIIFHSATVQNHYLQPASPDAAGSWGNNAGSASKPKVVKRGVDEFNIDEGEPEQVDHLLFLVHGIGSVCDLKFRTVEEVVDEFRGISFQLVQSHYRTACEQGVVNRIEVLPISWHTTLHSDTGIDKQLQAITLESIPKLRHFTNDTLLDILFYTSPIYCQTIMQTVGSEMNRLHTLFKERNPTFDGGIYLGGHSLGSLIMFDLLCHQKPTKEDENDTNNDEEDDSIVPIKAMPAAVLRRRLSRRVSYVMGAAGTGQPYIHYPQLNFHPRAFFALGSPIGMFVTVRGIDTLGENFTLPTCPAFFNIFHPFDPVAYRVESLINPEACNFRPMLIPHHKGRKRMHLELKETMARVGADLKQKLIDSVRHTWNSFYQLALFQKPDNQALEREIDKVVEEQLHKPPSVSDQQSNDEYGADLKIGKLNGGRRIDYVLQEAPFEYINEYIFALTSHICYWESEDTMLLILKEIYGSRGIQTDAQLPQQTMSIERVSPSPSLNLPASSPSGSNAGPSLVMGTDPTVPMSSKPVGPPPKTGFVPKS